MNLKRLILIIFCYFFSFNLFAETPKSFLYNTASKNIDVSANIVTFPYKQILGTLDQTKSYIQNNKFSSAIFSLNETIAMIQETQQQFIKTLFPSNIDTFEIFNPGIQINDMISQPIHFGVLFNQRYQNEQEHTIDVNIIFSDPSIEEYLAIIKNPQWLNDVESTTIIKINNKYFALEKYSTEENFCELNIILSDEILLNIVANGVTEKTIIDTFVSKIKFDQLKQYLTE